MNALDFLQFNPWVARLGWTLIHFLWQGAAVGVGLLIALYLLRRHGAPARYAAACGAMAIMAFLPLLTFLLLVRATAPVNTPTNPLARTMALSSNISPAPESSETVEDTSEMGRGARFSHPALPPIATMLPWIVVAWLVGVTVLSLRLLGGFAHIHRLRRKLVAPVEERWAAVARELSERLGIRRAVEVLTSPFPTSPLTVGWLRPVVLLPASALKVLAPEQLRSILAHELAHVRRHDFVVNVLQSLVEIVLFYHPMVWWTSRCIRAEREYCCDDMAVALCGDPLTYARALTQLEEARIEPVPHLAAAAFAGGPLLRRIQRLLAPAPVPTGRREWASGALTAALVLACLGTALGASCSQMQKVNAAAQAAEAPSVEPAIAELAPVEASPAVIAVDAAPPAPVAPGGVALLAFESVGNAERIGETCAQLHELVYNQLAGTGGIRMVDREELAEYMAELHLSEAGLVDAAAAVNVGRLTGASDFVSGKLMLLDDSWIFTARLIDTETSEVSGVRVTSTAAEGVLPLADAAANAIAKRLDARVAAPRGADEERPYAAEIAALRERLKGISLPRVVVKVPESHLGTIVPDPAGENALVAVLTEVGFTVVDVDTFIERTDSSSWWDLLIGGEAEDGARQASLRQGWRNPATLLHNTRLARLKENADIFIVGEAFSEYVGENHGFRSCQARVEVKAMDTATEAVAAADSRHASAADLGEFIAGKKALRLAGAELGLAVAGQLANYWQERSTSGQTP